MSADGEGRTIGAKNPRADDKGKDYVTVGSIAATVRRHLEALAPVDAADAAATGSPEGPGGVAMRRFVSLFAMPTAATEEPAEAAAETDAPAEATAGPSDDSAGRDLALQSRDIERLLKAVNFEPEHKLAIAVNLLLTKCTPAQRTIKRAEL